MLCELDLMTGGGGGGGGGGFELDEPDTGNFEVGGTGCGCNDGRCKLEDEDVCG